MKHGGLLTAVLILILCSLLGLASVSAADLTNDTLDDFQGDPVIGEINNSHAVGEKNNGDCLYVSVMVIAMLMLLHGAVPLTHWIGQYI